jgi:hypothetical protein
MNLNEIKAILKEHQIWLETGGKAGSKAAAENNHLNSMLIISII